MQHKIILSITLELLTINYYMLRNLFDLGILTFSWPMIYIGQIHIIKLEPDIDIFYYNLDLYSNIDNEQWKTVARNCFLYIVFVYKINRVDQNQHYNFYRVDQVGIDQMGIDQMRVDHMAVDQVGIKPFIVRYTCV